MQLRIFGSAYALSMDINTNMLDKNRSGITDFKKTKWYKKCAVKYNGTIFEIALNGNFLKARMQTCHQNRMDFVIFYQLPQMSPSFVMVMQQKRSSV